MKGWTRRQRRLVRLMECAMFAVSEVTNVEPLRIFNESQNEDLNLPRGIVIYLLDKTGTDIKDIGYVMRLDRWRTLLLLQRTQQKNRESQGMTNILIECTQRFRSLLRRQS